MNIKVKDADQESEDYLYEQINNLESNEIIVDRNERNWTLNNLRDIRVNYNEPIFISNLTSLQTEYFIDKVAQPIIRVGSAEDYAGKIEVLMSGGTNGGAEVYKSYFQAGVGTIIAMHVPEDVQKAVIEQNIGNIIIAPHMPSDSIGLLEIVKAWRAQGVEVTCMSGIVE